MGLNKALPHQQVGLGGEAVDEQLTPRGQGTQMDHVLGLAALMDHKAQAGVPIELLAVFVQQLGLSGGPMETGGHQDGNLRLRAARPDFSDQFRQDDLAGHGPGVVAADDDHIVLAPGQFLQAGGADGLLQRPPDQLRLPGGGMVAVGLGLEHAGQPLVRNLRQDFAPSVGQRYGCHR